MKSQKDLKKKQTKPINNKDIPKSKTNLLKQKTVIKQQAKVQTSKIDKKQPNHQQPDKNMPETKNSKIQIKLNGSSLAPLDTSITICKMIQVRIFKKKEIGQIQSRINSKGKQLLIRPFKIHNNQIVFSLQGLKTYDQMKLDLQDQFLRWWILQIFYQFHPSHQQNMNYPNIFIQIIPSNIFVQSTPYLSLSIRRQQKYVWLNPLRVLCIQTVQNQQQYLTQMEKFDEYFKKIYNIKDLDLLYRQKKLGNLEQQFYEAKNISKLISKRLGSSEESQDNTISPDLIKWASKQIGTEDKYNFKLSFRGSTLSFEPLKFWNKIKSCQVDEHSKNQIIVFLIKTKQKLRKIVGFYSNKLGLNSQMAMQILPDYINDTGLLLNFTQRTVHQLGKDIAYSFTFSKQILICIGKCDIVISAYNITNLCYFPVSYDPDSEGLCSNADALCGGKKFELEDILVYTGTNQSIQ